MNGLEATTITWDEFDKLASKPWDLPLGRYKVVGDPLYETQPLKQTLKNRAKRARKKARK